MTETSSIIVDGTSAAVAMEIRRFAGTVSYCHLLCPPEFTLWTLEQMLVLLLYTR
jgi:hypothetical protein